MTAAASCRRVIDECAGSEIVRDNRLDSVPTVVLESVPQEGSSAERGVASGRRGIINNEWRMHHGGRNPGLKGGL